MAEAENVCRTLVGNEVAEISPSQIMKVSHSDQFPLSYNRESWKHFK